MGQMSQTCFCFGGRTSPSIVLLIPGLLSWGHGSSMSKSPIVIFKINFGYSAHAGGGKAVGAYFLLMES